MSMVSSRAELAARLRKLADCLDRGDTGCTENDEDARREVCRDAQVASKLCWAGRTLPAPCRALVELLAAKPAVRGVEVRVVKPLSSSSRVAIVTCGGVAELVVKLRDRHEAIREECHYMLAGMLGLEAAAAPCIAVELRMPQNNCRPSDGQHKHQDDGSSNSSSDSGSGSSGESDDESNGETADAGGDGEASVLSLVAQRLDRCLSKAEGRAQMHQWVTIEKCIRLDAQPSEPAAALRNEHGCCMLEALMYKPTEPYCDLIARLSPASVHELCALVCVALNRDSTPSNLMFRQITPTTYAPVAIDAELVLQALPIDALRPSNENYTDNVLEYWYPACLIFPQAALPFDASVASKLLAADAGQVSRSLAQLLAAAPGMSAEESVIEAEAAAGRLRSFQALLRGQGGTLSVRDCCFAAAPCFARDWEFATQKSFTKPLAQLCSHLESGKSAAAFPEIFARTQKKKKKKQKPVKQ